MISANQLDFALTLRNYEFYPTHPLFMMKIFAESIASEQATNLLDSPMTLLLIALLRVFTFWATGITSRQLHV